MLTLNLKDEEGSKECQVGLEREKLGDIISGFSRIRDQLFGSYLE